MAHSDKFARQFIGQQIVNIFTGVVQPRVLFAVLHAKCESNRLAGNLCSRALFRRVTIIYI